MTLATGPDHKGLDRRNILKAASLAGTAMLAQAATSPLAAAAPPASDGPARDSQTKDGAATGTVFGGDYIVDTMRSLGIEYVAATPGNTFMGIHESVINYGMLTDPKLTYLTTMHEEASVAMCHGYAKVAGKPMACIMHSTVGLQHGSMAIYNAWADRAPVFMMVGAAYDANSRGSMVDWMHAVSDGPALVRDFTKWDDSPGSLPAFGDAAARAYKFAMTPPYGPVLLAVDAELQNPAFEAHQVPAVPRAPHISPPRADDGAVKEAARQLVAAENPVVLADRAARTPAGLALMIELAETLQAPVVDIYGRMNFPWRHPLNQTGGQRTLLPNADVVLGLEMTDFWGATNNYAAPQGHQSILPKNATRISISSVDLYMKANYQDFMRYTDADLMMAADAEASLPALIEAVRAQIDVSRKSKFSQRGERLAQAHTARLKHNRDLAALGWDERPISVPRLCAELWDQLRHEDWALVSGTPFQSWWPQKLWAADKHHQYIGDSGAYGIGYNAPASLGAALAHRQHGRLAVSIQGDGDLMMGPGILWTAAHERIPLLYVIHNNRSYQMEIMQLQAYANRRKRGIDRVGIGTAITNPNIDYAAMAKSLGVYAAGPIENPSDLGPALRKAIQVVKRGEPALLDVVAQGR